MVEEQDQATLTLHLLGEPQLLFGASSLAESLAGKEQALLYYMACQPDQRFSREHLSTLLWGEVPESRSRYNLRRALWNVRRTLTEVGLVPEECLAVEGSWIQIPSAAPFQVDVHDFEQVLQLPESKSRFSVSSEMIRRIRRVLDFYRGEFLSGFSVPNAPGFEEWLVLERERLFLLLLQALASLIQGFIARGERDEAIATCQRLLVLDPLQEDTHRLLMRLYWETGQRAQALRQYRTYQDLLERELSIEPLQETQDLYQQILQREAPPALKSSSLVLTSRTTPPFPAPESLPRPRLFTLLDRGLAVRLTLVSAPAGYGKTTLMAQWLADRSPVPPLRVHVLAVWYTVEEADNDPLTFLDGLAAAVSRTYPTLSQGLLDQVHDLVFTQGNIRQATDHLIGMLESLALESFVIVLDDLEHLNSSESLQVLRYLVEHIPATGHIYLLTRVEPPLPLPRLAVRGQLVEIRAADLRFTDEEVTAFLSQAQGLNLSPAEVAELTEQAEGWIASLWLAANAFGRFAANLEMVWEGVYAYLRDEVLTPQPAEVRTFLLQSAVLDHLTPSICQAVLDVPESVENLAQWLARMERHNLFLRRVVFPTLRSTVPDGADPEPQYAYHPLFLAFLRAELPHHLSQTEIEALHQRAARASERQGDPETALFHFQRIGDESGIARLLEQIAPTYLQAGRFEPLTRWIGQLEPAVRDKYPLLTLHAGRLCQAEGRVEQAHRLYQQAAQTFESQKNHASEGDGLLALAELALVRGRYAAGIELAQQAIDRWPEEDLQRHTGGLCIMGQLHACQGNLVDAELTLKQAKRSTAELDHPLLSFQVLRIHAWVAYVQGAYHRAMGINRLAEQAAGQDVSPEIVASFRNPVPGILREWGEREVAWEAAQRRLEAARLIQDRLSLSHACVDLGNLYLDQGQPDEAQRAFQEAVAEVEAAGEDGLLRLYAEAHLVYAASLQGHTKEAVEVAEAALHRCQARDASPLGVAIAQTAIALSRIGSPSRDPRPSLDQAYHAFERLGVRYGSFVSAILFGAVCLDGRFGDNHEPDQEQARGYVAKGLALAAAEGYAQTLVAARHITLPVMLFALREGIEPRFASHILLRMGPESFEGITRVAQDADPLVRTRVAHALEALSIYEQADDQSEGIEAILTTLAQLVEDPNQDVRVAAIQAQRSLRLSSDRLHRPGS